MLHAVELTKYPNIDQYKYSGYSIGFARKGFSSFGNEISRNVTIFWVDMSYLHILLGKCPTQGLEHTLTGEKLHLMNFTKNNAKFCLNLHNAWIK